MNLSSWIRTHNLVSESGADGESLRSQVVRHGRERNGQLDGAHRVFVQLLHARGAAQQDELQIPALSYPELDEEFTLDALVFCLTRVYPVTLDLRADLIEIVLVLRVLRVEWNGLSLDHKPFAIVRGAEHLGRGRRTRLRSGAHSLLASRRGRRA